MAETTITERKINIRDVNPLEHITSDLAKTRTNFESIMNGIVTWYNTDADDVTVRLSTDVDPFFVDYTFPSKKMYTGNANTASDPSTPAASLCYNDRVNLAVAAGETAVLRATVTGNTGRWRLFAMAVVHDEGSAAEASRNYRRGDIVRRTTTGAEDNLMHTDYVVTSGIAAGDAWDSSNLAPLYHKWNRANSALYESLPLAFAEYGSGAASNSLWFLSGTPKGGNPSVDPAWSRVSWAWNDMTGADEFYIEQDALVFFHSSDAPEESGELYLHTAAGVARKFCLPPYSDNGRTPNYESWLSHSVGSTDDLVPVVLYPVDYVTTATVIRHVALTDLAGFVLMPVSVPDDGSEVRIAANVAISVEPSRQPGGIRVLPSANYACWPESTGPKWDSGTVYGYDSDYTAKMVFHHRGEDARKVNVVNYDGPDLDRGLAIYLPVNDPVDITDGLESDCTPEDGYTMEFMFRIWPTPGLSGAESADLVINKAQIHVFSAAGTTDEELASAVTIAKFSMARVTTFHVWAENIAVPNRPVFYKAKFVYSAAAGNWVTYDYYQVPDCVFLSQGFVDPENPGYGVETAGFPMMRDIFTSTDMGRVVPAGD